MKVRPLLIQSSYNITINIVQGNLKTDDELLVEWLTQPGLVRVVLIVVNLRYTASRIWTCAESSSSNFVIWICELVITTTWRRSLLSRIWQKMLTWKVTDFANFISRLLFKNLYSLSFTSKTYNQFTYQSKPPYQLHTQK